MVEQKLQIMWRCKMINLSHKKGREDWIFQQDNAAIHNATIKKVLAWSKNKIFWPPCMLSRPQSYRKVMGLIVAKVYEGGQQYSAISELKNTMLDAWEKYLRFNFRN